MSPSQQALSFGGVKNGRKQNGIKMPLLCIVVLITLSLPALWHLVKMPAYPSLAEEEARLVSIFRDMCHRLDASTKDNAMTTLTFVGDSTALQLLRATALGIVLCREAGYPSQRAALQAVRDRVNDLRKRISEIHDTERLVIPSLVLPSSSNRNGKGGVYLRFVKVQYLAVVAARFEEPQSTLHRSVCGSTGAASSGNVNHRAGQVVTPERLVVSVGSWDMLRPDATRSGMTFIGSSETNDLTSPTSWEYAMNTYRNTINSHITRMENVVSDPSACRGFDKHRMILVVPPMTNCSGPKFYVPPSGHHEETGAHSQQDPYWNVKGDNCEKRIRSGTAQRYRTQMLGAQFATVADMDTLVEETLTQQRTGVDACLLPDGTHVELEVRRPGGSEYTLNWCGFEILSRMIFTSNE